MIREITIYHRKVLLSYERIYRVCKDGSLFCINFRHCEPYQVWVGLLGKAFPD